MTDNGNTAGASPNISPVATSMTDLAKFMTEAAAAVQLVPALTEQLRSMTLLRNDAQRHAQELELNIGNIRSEKQNALDRLAEVERERDTFRQQALDLAAARDRVISSVETAFSMVQDDIRQVMPQLEPAEAPNTPPPNAEPMADTASADKPPSHAYPEPNPSQKYAGLIYADYPLYVTLGDWLANGGTEESYWAKSTGSGDPSPF